ncbi:MAG: sigma factor-like helix-turn-helix DNA-binding protein [Terriglobia bacterium]
MTHSEIAQRTGEPLGTVKSRLRSALQSLRQVLNP